MPYLNQNGKIVEVTQAQFDQYTVDNNINPELTNAARALAGQPPLAPAGGTVLNNNSITTPILTPNTSSTSPNQALTQLYAQTSAPIPVTPTYTDTPGSLKVYGDATPVSSTVNPQASLTASETIVATDAPVSPAADPNAGISSADLGTTAYIAPAAAADPNAGISSADLGTTLAVPPTPTQDPNAGISSADLGTTAYIAPATAAAVDPNAGISSADLGTTATNATGTTNTGTGTSSDSANASAGIQGQITNAQNQQTIAEQRKQINNGDWRVRLRLAPQADYLYKAAAPGILQPLAITDGIIFPYTPQIDTSYRANYETYDLTHSNYRGYFYKNSYVDAINLKTVFTAQDTNDANYLLAVITFLKSVTKMFYGQDAQRGAPPPLVYLSGLGDFQFNEHPCVVSSFQYNLPDNVDYIRAGSPKNNGLNFINRRDRQSVATNSIFGSINRLAAAFLTKGAITGPEGPPTLGLNRPTYVPTKMDINLTLLPIQSRQQVSKQFSLKSFASGDLIKGGFW